MSTPGLRSFDQVAVVIPAHNEQANRPACLSAMLTAELAAISVTVIVVLDANRGSDVHSGDVA